MLILAVFLILYNSKGEGTVVEGEGEILDAIRRGFIYTKDTVPDMAPSKDFEDKILFVTGGETIEGNLWLANLNDLLIFLNLQNVSDTLYF